MVNAIAKMGSFELINSLDLKASTFEELTAGLEAYVSYPRKLDVKVDLMSRARRNEKYCDLTIVCGKYRRKVHRIVVCTRSKFFERACESGFKVGNRWFSLG